MKLLPEMMSVEVEAFGEMSDGHTASLYTIRNEYAEMRLTDLGATIVSISVQDRDGKMRDVVLGYDDMSGYLTNKPSFGSTVGRNTNRIGGARVEISGKIYELERNSGDNNIHSGSDRYKYRLWRADYDPDGFSVVFRLISPDMDQGFPGNAIITVAMSLFDTTVCIEYHAVADADTLFNMTNHSYFNLDGRESDSVCGHLLRINASGYTVCDDNLVPTGEIAQVDGTPFDFRELKQIGKDMESPVLSGIGGYDHNFVLGDPGEYEEIAELRSDNSGIGMFVRTTEPGLQVYTANNLNEPKASGGFKGPHSAVCLETQHFPDAPNHPEFPSSLVKVGEPYDSMTQYVFFNY